MTLQSQLAALTIMKMEGPHKARNTETCDICEHIELK